MHPANFALFTFIEKIPWKQKVPHDDVKFPKAPQKIAQEPTNMYRCNRKVICSALGCNVLWDFLHLHGGGKFVMTPRGIIKTI